MTKRKREMPVMSPVYEVCALRKSTKRMKPLYPHDMVRIHAEDLSSTSWGGIKTTTFHVEKLVDGEWVKWSNPIHQSDVLRIVCVIEEDEKTTERPDDETIIKQIQNTICLPRGMRLEASGFDGPWDLPEIIKGWRGTVLFVREVKD